MVQKLKIVAGTCVKNEGALLLEWIAFNRVLGVTDFLFYSNDCTDGTDTFLDVLAEQGIVKHLPNPAEENRNYQMVALKASREDPMLQDADWIWVSDVDEFLNIKTGDGTLTDLITACDDPMAISINFQMFANDGVTAYVDEPVISQFLKSHEPDEFNGEKAIEVKSLFKRDLDPQIQFYGAHRPFLRKNVETPPHWTDGSGKQVASRYAFAATKARKRKFRAINSRDLATLNHYTLRSLESYLVKTDRGDVNREHRVFEDDYWNERNDCTYSDDSILNYMPRLQAEMDALKALPGVADQHAACVKAHADKAASLMARPQYIELRDRLAKQDGKSS